MRIALTGATGFLGRFLVAELTGEGHQLCCWYRTRTSQVAETGAHGQITWIRGDLGSAEQTGQLVHGCDAVVHAALYRPGRMFRGGEGDLVEFAEKNVIGSLRLIEAARAAGAERFIFISTCAVHETILDDRPLDEGAGLDAPGGLLLLAD